MSDLVIETTGLTRAYGDFIALDGLDLRVPRHAIFGFLGPNGAGKTTTLRLLLGMTRPTAGSGRILGMDIVRDSIEIRRRVGYLAQSPRFYDHMTARETLRLAARFFYTGPRDLIEQRVDETLDLVGLTDRADRPTRGFSGGERQRLGIAQAQINHPDVLILDEPAAALDPMGRRGVGEVMRRRRQHSTVFYSTHILDDVQRVSDSVAILNSGRLVAQAPIETLLASREGTVFMLAVRGSAARIEQARARIVAETWVQSVMTVAGNSGVTHWQIAVDDPAAAEARLLRLALADDALTVTAFGRQQYELEDIFMSIVEESGR